jgi:hypothetical protein
VLLLGLLTLTQHKVTQIIFAGITVLIILVRFARFVFGENWMAVWDIPLSIMSLITFVIVLLTHLLQFQKNKIVITISCIN